MVIGKNQNARKTSWDRFDSLVGLRYFVRVFRRDVPGCELLVCACATLDVARSFARSYDQAYYEVGLFDSDCEMRPVDF